MVVPVLVGTAGVSPDLGYAVPAGEWAIQVVLDLKKERGQRQRYTGGRQEAHRAPLLPIAVTD